MVLLNSTNHQGGEENHWRSKRSSPNSQKRVVPKENALPIPKGDSSYANAKRAEYILKDLELAKELYWRALKENDRAESAVKDISSILHQQHRTEEACELLTQYKHLFTDTQKFLNLYNTLHKQITPTGNSLNMVLRISPITLEDSIYTIRGMFKSSQRIRSIQIGEGHALLVFASHSAARKTLESFTCWSAYRIEWLSLTGEVQGEAGCGYTIHKKPHTKEEVAPELPRISRAPSENTAELLLGSSLYKAI